MEKNCRQDSKDERLAHRGKPVKTRLADLQGHKASFGEQKGNICKLRGTVLGQVLTQAAPSPFHGARQKRFLSPEFGPPIVGAPSVIFLVTSREVQPGRALEVSTKLWPAPEVRAKAGPGHRQFHLLPFRASGKIIN